MGGFTPYEKCKLLCIRLLQFHPHPDTVYHPEIVYQIGNVSSRHRIDKSIIFAIKQAHYYEDLSKFASIMLQLKNSIDFDLEAMVKGINNYNHFAIRRNTALRRELKRG